MGKELISIFKSKMKIATLLAVIILPLIYGGLYLWAFWDPYSQIDKIPVAVVDQDNGWKDENLGKDLVDSLKEKNAMKWNFVDKTEAESGLTSGKYYTAVFIPQDFSQRIINADKDGAKSTYLQYKNREATNFMAAKFSTSAMNKIQLTLNQEITKRYFDEVFKESRKSANDLKEAVDGSIKLKDGGHDIATASAKLSDGLFSAYNGAGDLYSGLDSANNGAQKIRDGVDTLSVGTSNLGGLVQMMQQYLSDNHDATMSAYMAKLSGGFGQMSGGVATLKMGTGDLKDGMVKLKDGAKKLWQINCF